jgi:hypothetical protein
MSDDIVKRLREWGDNAGPETAGLHMEAADEIDRLRAALADVVATAKPIPNLPGWTSVPKRAIDNARRVLDEESSPPQAAPQDAR